MPTLDLWSMLFVFMLATFVGFQVIQNVSRLLHTPLMSLTNAISAIAVVGSILIAGEQESTFTTMLGTVAVAASMTNIVSGFLITDRMLKMFREKAAAAARRRSGPSRDDGQPHRAGYLVAAALFILSLRWLNASPTARRGVCAGVAGMTLAIIGTLLAPEIIGYKWIIVALVVGIVVGVPLSWVPLTAVPQRTALSHAFGGLAAGLVGIAKYFAVAAARAADDVPHVGDRARGHSRDF